MNKTTNTYADIMLEKISQCVEQKNKNMPSLSGAIVSSVNTNGTVNVYFPPDNNKIFTNISNQTPFSLKPGDSVELLLKDGSYNNCWVVAKHKTTYSGIEDIGNLMQQYATLDDLKEIQASLITETDPFYHASPAATITQQDITRWNDAVAAVPSSSTPVMDSGNGSVGSQNAYARGDHVHPTDTSRAPLVSPEFTGTPLAPTASASSDNNQIATTAFVKTAISGLTSPVTSVNSKTGDVVLTASDVGALSSDTSYVSSFNGSSGAVTYTAPVASVNSKTGSVVLTASDVGALSSNTDLTIYMQKGVDYVTAGKKSDTTLGTSATAEGTDVTASGDYSHAEGYNTTANHKSQHVFGEYNILDTNEAAANARGDYVEIVGNGTGTSERSNARTLDWSGNEVLAGKLTVGSAPTELMDVTTKQYVDTNFVGFNSPRFTGTPTAPTPTSASSNTQIATKEYVDNSTSTTVPMSTSDIDAAIAAAS